MRRRAQRPDRGRHRTATPEWFDVAVRPGHVALVPHSTIMGRSAEPAAAWARRSRTGPCLACRRCPSRASVRVPPRGAGLDAIPRANGTPWLSAHDRTAMVFRSRALVPPARPARARRRSGSTGAPTPPSCANQTSPEPQSPSATNRVIGGGGAVRSAARRRRGTRARGPTRPGDVPAWRGAPSRGPAARRRCGDGGSATGQRPPAAGW